MLNLGHLRNITLEVYGYMDIQIFDTPTQASKQAFTLFEQALGEGANVFGLATGSTPVTLYDLLVKSNLDFSQATAINLDEYCGLPADHPQSYATFMKEHLFNAKPFKASYIPNGLAEDPDAEAARYEGLIDENPVDLQILGLGKNGHIGFNEPGAKRDSVTHLTKLTDSTIQANARFFDTIDQVPTHAISMGIASILKAKHIVLLAFGANKAQAVKAMIEGPITSDVPASFLQEHPHVTVLLDTEAASLLSE